MKQQYIFIDDSGDPGLKKSNTTPKLPHRETLYNYAIKNLLLNMQLSGKLSIVIDGVADRKPAQQTRTYLRQALKQCNITKCTIKFVDSRKDPLVQLADIIAGSVARSYDKNKADHKDYLKLLKPKIKEIYEITP